MSTDLVSIIMPAHNAQDTIAEAIASVLAQVHPHWELIIIENGSSDATASICQQVADPRLVFLQHSRSGLSRARNLGLEKARGQFICFLDSDDILPPLSLSTRLSHFEQYPEASFCDGTVIKKNEGLTQVLEVWKPRIPSDLRIEMHKLNAGCFCGVTWLIRKSALGTVRFDETWSHLEDRKFFSEMAQHGQYMAVEDVVYIIRRRRGSLMSNHLKLQLAYRRFLQFVAAQDVLTPSEIKKQNKFYTSMFFKTHIKTGHLIAALRVLFEK